jgi:perosamine synthetase
MINIYEPYLNQEVTKFAKDAIDSGWLSSNGKYLNLVKDKLAEINQSNYVILCNNGTTATHLLAVALRYKFPKIKNLIVPNNVYVAAWNSFLVNPIFNLIPIDSNLDTWNFDLEKLDDALSIYSSEDTAVLIVHNIGNIINVPRMKEKYSDYTFIEDNCEGFLGEYSNYKSGSKSLVSSVSFYGNKTITCGEGGAVFTDDPDLFEFLDSTRTQGSTTQKFIFDKLGYNYRMTNIQAALLYGQLNFLNEILEKKDFVFDTYKRELSGFEFQKEENDTIHSKWMFGLKLNHNIKQMTLNLYEQGVETRPMFPPVSYHKHLSIFKSDELNSEILYNNSIILPSHPNLDKKQIQYITKIIKKFYDKKI